jgi:short-subunit dehydrogenase
MSRLTRKPLSATGIARYRGGWALITGAARLEGLGYAFARQLAGLGVNLVLVDILDQDLHSRADELRRDFGIEVRTVACDLGAFPPYEDLETVVQDLDVDVLVCNHMYTPEETPTILDLDLDVHLRMIDINARAYTALVHRFGRAMRDRGRGAIVIVSSGVGLTSGPYNGGYAANKAFQIILGETLWYELRGTGVDVLVMIGGLMNTQGEAFSQYPQWLVGDRDNVAPEVLAAIGRKHMIVPGVLNRAFVLAQTRLSSRRRTVSSIGRFMEKGLGK